VSNKTEWDDRSSDRLCKQNGRSMVYAPAKEGASIVVVDRNIDGANAVVINVEKKGGKAICVKADVKSTNELDAMANEAMDSFGKVNILVNNAGARVIKGFLEHNKGDWDTMLGIKLSGPFFCSQAIVPKMMTCGGGNIIDVCSIASYVGRLNRCAYVAAKSGLLGLTRTMAIDLALRKVRVNGISPGMIASPFNQRFSEGEETGFA
jgi:NAD(P)-dependent dehydrogenase (short-subunit alcohol dehydrogenase family)